MNNDTISIEKAPFVSIKELNTVLKELPRFDKGDQVTLDFKQKIERIDIAFMAGLILAAKENDFQFIIKLKDEIGSAPEVRKYLMTYNKIYGSLDPFFKGFNFLHYSGIGKDGLKKMYTHLSTKDFNAASSYAPIFFVNKDTIHPLFEKPHQTRFQEITTKYVAKIETIGTLSSQRKNKESQFFGSLGLHSKSIVFVSAYYILASKLKLFAVLKSNDGQFEEKYREQEIKAKSLWEFTESYVSGLQELAKNIVEHSTSKQGMITIRAYDSNLKHPKGKRKSDVIEKDLITHVIDFGTKGIVENLRASTLRNASSEEFDEHLKGIFQQDVEILNTDYSVRDFFESHPEKQLNQQTARELTHFGLLKFYNLIRFNEGIYGCSSSTIDKKDKSGSADVSGLLDTGTHFYFELPFKQELFKLEKHNAVYPDMEATESTIKGLSNFLTVFNTNTIFDVKPIQKHIQNRLEESSFVKEINKKIDEQINISKERGIHFYAGIDLEGVEFYASSLLRVLAHLSSRQKKCEIIVLNLSIGQLDSFFNENRIFVSLIRGLKSNTNSENIPFWVEDKALLFYSYHQIKTDKEDDNCKFYFSDILYGKNEKEFESINHIISHSFPNRTSIIRNNDFQVDKDFQSPNSLSPFFYQSVLYPFDLLLNKNPSLFVQNLKFQLEKELVSKIKKRKTDESKGILNDPISQYMDDLDGYKIKDSHFKLGAKIHVNDFIYAKRLFQNSYYTSRIAMFLAKMIRDRIPRERRIKEKITLIGYEIYSELLISLVQKFLIETGFKNVNHIVTLDTMDGLKRLPESVNINPLCIIIVPITSTGSTFTKIKSNIVTRHKENNNSKTETKFHEYSIIDVFDSNDHTKSRETSHYGILQLETKWEKPKDCIWCFDETKSRPLFETDKTSLTPALIFDFPKSKRKKDLQSKAQIDSQSLSKKFEEVNFDDALYYRRMKRNHEHFLFSHNSEKLIDNNRLKIRKWLNEVKVHLNIKPTQKVILLTPSHHSNTTFINMVNDLVFHSSATIIHHQTDVDYLSNFKLLNSSVLIQKNILIFYVDDTLISGSTFFKIYDLFRYACNYKKIKSLTGSIFLSNKAAPEISKRVLRASKDIFSFVNINLPIPPKVLGKKPLELEIENYKELSRVALHDAAKSHFRRKQISIEHPGLLDNKVSKGKSKRSNLHTDPQLFDENQAIDSLNTYKEDRYQRLFKATHHAYHYFGNLNGEVDLSKLETLIGDSLEDKIAVFKVLSQYPFYLFKPVKEEVFHWHKDWFKKFINSLDLTESLKYADFELFKFLFRRSVLLDNFIIVETKFLEKLFEIVDHFMEKSKNSNFGELELLKIKDLPNFMVYQYIELFERNPWTALKMKAFLDENDLGKTSQYKRMISIELASVLNDFYEMLKDFYDNSGNYSIAWKNALIYDNSSDWKKTSNLKDFLNKYSLHLIKSNKFELSNLVLNLKTGDEFSDQFLNFLWIKHFLQNDLLGKVKDHELKQKTDAIMQKIKGLFPLESSLGALLIVTDNKKRKHLVFNEDQEGNRIFEDSFLGRDNLITKFLDGVPTDSGNGQKSIIEYKTIYDSNMASKLVDSYKNDEVVTFDNQTIIGLDGQINYDNKPFHVYFDSFLMIRIAEHKKAIEGKPASQSDFRTLGVICVFGKGKDGEEVFNILGKRLVMLLRNDIGRFIIKHHKNDEFAALREAEAVKRFAYLAGHGRHVMQALAFTKGIDYNGFPEIVATLDFLQYFIATKHIEDKKEEFIKKFPKSKIEPDFLSDMQKMAHSIFKTEIIENEVPVSIPHCSNQIIEANYIDSRLLKFICFELLVNAKKNRFHFIENSLGILCVNALTLNLIENEGCLTLSISCTGPTLNVTKKNLINDAQSSIKNEDEISGIKLIKDILFLMNKKNQISIRQKESDHCENCKVPIVEVEVKLFNI